jgi:hypothetical protein
MMTKMLALSVALAAAVAAEPAYAQPPQQRAIFQTYDASLRPDTRVIVQPRDTGSTHVVRCLWRRGCS